MVIQEQVANVLIPIGKAIGVLACVSAGSKRLTVGNEKPQVGAGEPEQEDEQHEDEGDEAIVGGKGDDKGAEALQASAEAYNQSLDAGLFAPDIFTKKKVGGLHSYWNIRCSFSNWYYIKKYKK